MTARISLDPTWRDWVLLNLQRGCSRESMISDMVRAGLDPVLSRSSVELLARETIAPSTPSKAPLRDVAADWFGTTEVVVGAVGLQASSGQVTAPRPNVPAPIVSRNASLPYVADGNVIHTSDREVHIVMRFKQPNVILLADLLSPEECDELVRISAPKIQRSTTVDPATGEPMVIENRTSHGTFFHLNETEFIARLDRRIAEVTHWPVENGEGLQIIQYGIGGEYKTHFDYFPPQDAGSEHHMSQGGQRVATLITYLNDVEAGGTTEFPEIGLSISPRKGQAVYFSYFNALGQINPLTLHAGAPVLKGEKWIATKWMRQWRRS